MTTRKDAIIEAATVLFAEKGFRETSTAEIAERSGVAQGTLFYHFKNKEGILLTVHQGIIDSYFAGLSEAVAKASCGLAAIEEAVRFHFSFAEARRTEILVILRDFPAQFSAPGYPHRETVAQRSSRVIGLLAALLDRGVADGSIRTVPTEETAHMLRAMLWGITRQRMLGPLSAPEVQEETVAFVRHALASDTAEAGGKGA